MIAFNTEAYLENYKNNTIREFDFELAAAGGQKPLDWQNQFRARLKQSLGMHFISASSEQVPLQPRLEDTKEFDSYFSEKWYIATEMGIEIPFYLLLPKQRKGPLPLILTTHGHGNTGKETYVDNFSDLEERKRIFDTYGDQDIAVQAVKEGYAVIAPDVRAFGEMSRPEEVQKRYQKSCNELQRMALMMGRTLIGERVHDMGKLIDYAETRAEIDAGRIAIIGHSGGGTVSLFTAACDERISIAVPSSYFCTFMDSIMSYNHCPCNFIPGILQLAEMYDIAGLIAPRPILAVHGETDESYPIHGTRYAYAKLQTIYQAFGAADNCELYVGDGGHRHFKDPVWRFIQKNWINS
ncbi:MAG: hypothetical protein JWN30_604 [Bacilli bacterium]|nr:hypothetical protein [Bacilli bacterium]